MISAISPRQKLWQKYFLPCFSPSCGRNTFLPGRKPTLLDGDAVRTSFMQLERVADGKAKTMYDCLTSVFASHNIPTKKVCIASFAYSDDDVK